ncbi:MAG: MBL fold metallo-hydrolase [Psychrobium sp.]
MQKIYDNLWQSTRYSSGMLNTHAYLLQRKNGNILFYNTGAAEDLLHIESLGGVAWQLITHRDEVGASQARIRTLFDNKLATSELEAPYAAQHSDVDVAFTPLDESLEDIQVIHTPGHTDGSVCYFYNPPHGKSYLFTGDTLAFTHDEFSTFVLNSFGGTNKDMIESLQKLRELTPDVVLCSGFVGETAYREVTVNEWLDAIDGCIAKLRS